MVETNKLISIILPTYNGERFLAKSIESCIYQTYKNIELIIIDDGSSDNSLKIANNYSKKDDRIRVLKNSENRNLPASLNIGHKSAQGNFITWISDDNYFAPTALEALLNFIIQSKADIVFSNFKIINEMGEEIDRYRFSSNSSILLENIVRASFLYKKQVFKRNNGYDEELFKIEDYAFWLMASSKSIIKHLPKELYYYRKHSQSLTSKKTISEFQYERAYVEKVKKMYSKFFQKWEIERAEKMATIFAKLHLHQELDVILFLKNYNSYLIDLEHILRKYGCKNVRREIDTRIRANVLRFKSNQTPETLLWLILKRPQMLYSHSKKKSLKIICKSLFSSSAGSNFSK